MPCDVADEKAVAAAFAATVERFDRVDACFANAGVGATLTPFTEFNVAAWRATMAVNLEGAVTTLREGRPPHDRAGRWRVP